MCKATRWEAAEPTLKAATRAHGLATWAVTGRGKLAVQHLQNTATPDGLRPSANGRNPLQATKHTKAENTPLRHFNTPPPRHSRPSSNPPAQTTPVPLRSSVRGTRTSGARTQGDARGRTRCTSAPFVPDERGACERSKHAGYAGAEAGRPPVPLRSSVRGTRTSGARTQGDARGGEGPPPQIPTSPEPTPPPHPTPQPQTSFPILHILVQPNCRNRGSNRSRNQSPKKFNDITVKNNAVPGITDVHHAVCK